MAFSPGNLSTSSSASSTLGSPDTEEYILSFETIDKMRRVSSYSALNSLIGECRPPHAHAHTAAGAKGGQDGGAEEGSGAGAWPAGRWARGRPQKPGGDQAGPGTGCSPGSPAFGGKSCPFPTHVSS